MSIQGSVNKILGSVESITEKVDKRLSGIDVNQKIMNQSMARVNEINKVKQTQLTDLNKRREDLYIGGQKIDPNSQLYKVLQQKVETQGGFKDGK